MSIQIPEGYHPAPWSKTKHDGCGYVRIYNSYQKEIAVVHWTGDNTDQTAELITLAPQMAAEIKRLEADAEAADASICTLAKTCSMLRARILALEAALGLPEGCDPWELERAMKEGVRDATGTLWKYDKSEYDGQHRFSRVNGEGWNWFNDDGQLDKCYGIPAVRLYCIKEAGK